MFTSLCVYSYFLDILRVWPLEIGPEEKEGGCTMWQQMISILTIGIVQKLLYK